MITTKKIPYGENAELRIGWATWDKGLFKKRSIKYAYKDASGKISRAAPEVPIEVLPDMALYALEQGEIRFGQVSSPRQPEWFETASDTALREEEKALRTALLYLQALIQHVPWVDFQPQYDAIGAQKERVHDERVRRTEKSRLRDDEADYDI